MYKVEKSNLQNEAVKFVLYRDEFSSKCSELLSVKRMDTVQYDIAPSDAKVTPLAWDSARAAFVQGNDMGEVFLAATDAASEQRKAVGDEAVTAVAVHPAGSSCALATGEEVVQRELPNVGDQVGLVARKELPVVHAAYDSAGKHM